MHWKARHSNFPTRCLRAKTEQVSSSNFRALSHILVSGAALLDKRLLNGEGRAIARLVAGSQPVRLRWRCRRGEEDAPLEDRCRVFVSRAASADPCIKSTDINTPEEDTTLDEPDTEIENWEAELAADPEEET